MTVLSELLIGLLGWMALIIGTGVVFVIFYQVFRLVRRPEWGGWAMLLAEVLLFDTDLKHAGAPLFMVVLTGFMTWAVTGAETDERRSKRSKAEK